MTRATVFADPAHVAELEAACRAALKYDEAIRGRASEGESWVEGANLDALYLDWMTKARKALNAPDPESIFGAGGFGVPKDDPDPLTPEDMELVDFRELPKAPEDEVRNLIQADMREALQRIVDDAFRREFPEQPEEPA